MKSDVKKLPFSGQPLVVPTVGEILANGTIVEVVSSQPRSTQLSLLARRGKRTWSGPRLQLNNRLYTPAEIPGTILENMRFPALAIPYGSTRSLFDSLVRRFDRLRLPPRDAKLSAHFALATHFVDVLRIAPCLQVAAADSGDAVQYLQVLAAMCRRPLLLADLVSGLNRLPRGLRPTLLFSGSSFSSAALRALLASQRRGFGVLEKFGVTDPCCAKAMVVDEKTPEELLSMPSVQVYISPDPARPVADDPVLNEIASTLQPRLLDYRCRNYEEVRNSTFDAAQFAGPTREIARAFGACIVGDSELQSGVISALRAQDEAARGDRWTRLDSLVVESLLVLCHENDRRGVYIGDVAKVVNGILEGRNEEVRLKARKVGDVVRSLNVVAERDAKGFGFLLLNDVRRKIHELARALDVAGLRENAGRCEFCAAVVDAQGA